MSDLGPRRLHPAAAVARAVGGLRDAVLPALVAIVIGGGSGGFARGLLFALAVFALGVVGGILSWRRTRYSVDASGLRLISGAWSPDETLVPLSRIQAVDTVQGPVQRAFDVVAVRVQTPGGGKQAEVELPAVTRAAARELREALGHPEPPAPVMAMHLRPRELLLAALTAPQFGVVVPIVGALGAVVQDSFTALEDRVGGDLTSARAIATIVVVALVVAWIISFLGALVTFAGFTLERHDGEGRPYLLIRRGFLQRRAATVPIHRIDGVAVVEGLLRAPIGRATLRVEVAGYRGEATAARTLFPLVRTRDVPALLEALAPDLAGDLAVDERPGRRALAGYLGPRAAVGLVVGLVPAIVLGGVLTALPVLLVALGVASGLASHAAAGLGLHGDRLVVRRRLLARTTLVARAHRLQELDVRRSPLQRRAGLSTLRVALGTGRRSEVMGLGAGAASATYAALAPPPRPAAAPA